MSEQIFFRFADHTSVAHAVPMVLRAFAESADCIPKLRIAESNDEVWLKLTEACRNDQLRQLPGVVYRVDQDVLIRQDRRVPERPVGSLNELPWQSLENTTDVTLPVPKVAPPLDADLRRPLQLTRGGAVVHPDGLLANIDALKAWCETAPQSRLQGLRWVTGCDDQRCLVLGKPLPPIEGIYLVADQRVLVPGGWTWTPRVDSRTVCEILDVPPDHWLLWESCQSHSMIPEQAFAVMTRASVRAT